MSKIVTASEALKRIADSPIEEPIQAPIETMPSEITPIIIDMQNKIAGLTFAVEAMIDLLKVYDVLDSTIFQISYQNVIEYSHSMIAGEKMLEVRARALKKKLADYSRSKNAPAEAPPAEKPKSGKVKKHG
jgi:hypothetical protein